MHPNAALGSFIFMIETAAYQTLQRTTAQRWSSHDRVGKRAAHQWLGDGDDELTIPGYILPEFCGPQTQLSMNIVRMIAAKGEPQMFIVLSAGGVVGDILGKWIILSVDETQSEFFGAVPQRIDFSIKLKRYESSQSLLGALIGALF